MFDKTIYEGLGRIVSTASQTFGKADFAALWKRLKSLSKQTDLTDRIEKARRRHWSGAVPYKESPDLRKSTDLSGGCKMFGVDGSQIYPDMDSPLFWGYARAVAYGLKDTPLMRSEFYDEELLQDSLENGDTKSWVDGARTVLEMRVMREKFDCEDSEVIGLFDGPLLPFMGHNSDFIGKYQWEYQEIGQRIIAGVVSQPRSRLIVNLIRLADASNPNNVTSSATGIKDRHIMLVGLKDGQRSAVFLHGSPRNDRFLKAGLGVYFFFLRLDNQIMRVEIPQWVADNDALIDMVHRGLIYNCVSGYPYVLAMAHETVVVSQQEQEAYRFQAKKRFLELTGFLDHPSAKSLAKGN